jgi:hypothetical protein
VVDILVNIKGRVVDIWSMFGIFWWSIFIKTQLAALN